MTTEAFTKRGMERQNLIDHFMRVAHEEEERRDDPTFLFMLVLAISEYLQRRRLNSPPRSITQEDGFLAGRFLIPIGIFSRSRREEDALLAKLLEQIVRSAVLHFHSQLQQEESYDPETIFRAPSAMTEMPIDP